MPMLEAMIRFSGQRQGIIQHNIANLSTPGYQHKDVDVGAFQDNLADAVESRARKNGGRNGALELHKSRQLRPSSDGGFRLTPQETDRGILFHDRNNRDLERQMQDLAENVATFRVASELYRSRSGLLRAAITERP
jgi:flagellar basal-body rod protein FlgB